MEVYNKLRNSLILLGFNSENGKYGIRVMMYIIITLIMYSNCTLHLIYNWQNLDSRINDLKGFVFFTLFFLYLLYFLTTWNDFHLLYSIIMKGLDYEFFCSYTSDKQNKLLKKINEELLNSHNIMYYAIKIYITIANLFPLIGAIFIIVKIKILGNGNDKNLIEKLPLLYPFYYPSQFENLFVYFTAYLLQCTYMTYLGIHGYITYSAPFNSMQIIAGNIKLLRSTIDEFEGILVINNRVSKLNLNGNTNVNNYYEKGDKENNSNDHANSHNENSNPENYLKIMNCYLTHIIKQHQIICSKVNTVNKGIQKIAFTLNFGASIYVCFSICFIIQKDEIKYKLIEGCLCILALYIVLVFDFTGEKIINEWEYLRTALYDINWINKPQWLKKKLLIIITYNNRGIEIKPYGLFVLNLKNLSLFINAVYSYYTLLNTIKNK